jgi:putative membrane protein
MKRGFLMLGVLISGLWFTPGLRAEAPAAVKKAEAPLPDEEILSRLHLTNQDEIHAGELAEQFGVAENVKQFGIRLQKDHKDADVMVRALAGRLGIKLRQAPTPQTAADKAVIATHQQRMAQLETLKGAAFDKKFISLMARSHQSSVQALEHQRILLPKDSPVQDLLTQLLPTLRDHYQIAATLGDVSN